MVKLVLRAVEELVIPRKKKKKNIKIEFLNLI